MDDQPDAIRDGTREGLLREVAELRRREAQYRLLVENSEDVLWILDLSGRYVYCSPSVAQTRGFSAEEVVAGSVADTLTPQSLAVVKARLEAIAAGAPVPRDPLELEVRCRDGSTRWAEALPRPVFDAEGRVVAVTGVTRDITARREAEGRLRDAYRQLEHASQVKDAFLAAMSHEIRTPMNGVLGMIELLLGTPLTPEQKRFLEIARSSGRALLSLLDDLLDFSKLVAGKLSVELVPVDLGGLVGDVVLLMTARAEAKSLTLTEDISTELPPCVLGDPLRLRQVLLNLIGNAVKFTEHGGAHITVRPGEDGTIRFAVRDTGIGVPEERRAELFSDFYQGGPAVTRRFGGSGLGLAIAKRLVEAMGGAIGFSDVPVGGSEFWFTLPLRAAEPPPRAEPEPVAEAPLACPPLRILLAEDVVQNAQVARAVLERDGHAVNVVENGAQAVAMAAAADFDVVLMDVFMPEMDGIEATRRIRALGHATRSRVPIVALTANILPQAREECRAAGMDDVQLKPIDIVALRRSLAAVAAGRSPPPAEAPPGGTALDAAWIADMLSALPPARFDELLQRAGLAMAEHLGAVESHARAGDWPALAGAAHRLAGLAASYGCSALRTAAAAVEDAAADRSEHLPVMLGRLAGDVQKALDALEALQRQRRASGARP